MTIMGSEYTGELSSPIYCVCCTCLGAILLKCFTSQRIGFEAHLIPYAVLAVSGPTSGLL